MPTELTDMIGIATIPALVASLPVQWGTSWEADDIPDRVLFLLRLREIPGTGWTEIDNLVWSPVTRFDPLCACEMSNDLPPLTLTTEIATGIRGRALAIILDNTADYIGANGYEHALLLAAASVHLREHGIRLLTSYAATRTDPGSLTWSTDTDEACGQTPAYPAIDGPKPNFALATHLTRRRAIALPRAAD